MQPQYKYIAQRLADYGTVLSPNVADQEMSKHGETELEEDAIFERELQRLGQADIVVAEVSIPSHGAGVLIAKAADMGKRIVCLYLKKDEYQISAMITGDKRIDLKEYQTDEDLDAGIAAIFK